MRSVLTATSQILPVLALAAALTASGALAQDSQSKAGKPSSAKSGMMSGNMGDQCKQTMTMHTQIMAEMKALDSSLDQKVAAMNGAKGNAKVDAIAAVINEMSTQRTQMRAKMSGMQDHMVAHMGEHMAQSGAAMKQSMADCPMMKGMKGMEHK